MRHNRYLYPAFFAVLFCACSVPARKAPQAGAAPVPARPAAVAELSTKEKNKVEGLYYRAVGAYSNNDMDATMKYLNEISTLYPSYPPAAELRGKMRGVSGAR